MPSEHPGQSWPTAPAFDTGLYAGTAELYAAHRIPYPDRLLDDLRPHQPADGLLDLACGTGELAIPLSNHFGTVWAADQEPTMVATGQRKATAAGIGNITWLTAKAEDLTLQQQSLDLITIGNAFHRLNRPAIARLATRWLKPGTVLAIVNTDSVWRGNKAWQQAAVELIAKWAPAPTKPSGNVPRLTHQDVLEQAGFVDLTEKTYSTEHTWTIDTFIGYLHSTSLAPKAALGLNTDAFETQLRQTLLALEPKGLLCETAGFSCLTARRPPHADSPAPIT